MGADTTKMSKRKGETKGEQIEDHLPEVRVAPATPSSENSAKSSDGSTIKASRVNPPKEFGEKDMTIDEQIEEWMKSKKGSGNGGGNGGRSATF